MSKFLGFLLGIAVALVGPAVFGVLAADGGIELNAKEMALAYGIGALIFWTVVSYFSGAAALGAALTFGAMIYAVNWIPNRTTNFLNDIPGVTTGMIEGIKQYTLNGVVPILAVISLVFGIQLIVQSMQARRRQRAEADLRQREQELAQAQQAAEAAAVYPVAGGDYPTSVDNRMGGSNFSGNTSYDDLFDEDPAPYPPRDQAEEQTTQYAVAEADADREDTVLADAEGNSDDETMLVPTDKDETVVVPVAGNESADQSADDEQASQQQATAMPDSPAEQRTEETASTQSAAEPAAEPSATAPAVGQTPPDQAADEQAGPTGGSAAGGAGGSSAGGAGGSAEDRTVESEAPKAESDGPGAEQENSATPPTATTAPAPTATPAPTPTATPAPAPTAPPAPASTTPPAPSPEAPAAGPAAPPAAASKVTPVAPPNDVPESQARAVPEKEQRLERNEQVGQQYRERMDGPELEETSEFHFDAFENPNRPEEDRPQAPRIMDLPGQFRPAGA